MHEPSRSRSSVLFHADTGADRTGDPVPPVDSALSNRKKGGSPTVASAAAPSLAVYELASHTNTPHTDQEHRISMDASASESLLAADGGRSLLSSHTVSVSSSPATSHPQRPNRRKRRLPQSGLTLCGRRWLLGAEDMCLPACWSAQFDLLLVVLAAVAWRHLYTSEFADTCSTRHRHELETYVVLHAAGYILLMCTDVATMFSAIRSNMFKRNRGIVYLIYLRLLTTAAIVVLTLVANIQYFHELRSACPADEQYAGSLALHRLLMVLFLASLCSFLVFGTYFVCSYGFGPCCGKGTMQSWGKHLQRWLLCYTPAPNANGRNVLESISWLFTEFFAADRAAHEGEPIHIVPSDVLVGFALVEANQVRRAVLGYKFLKAAPKNRWMPDAFQPHRVAAREPEAQQRAREDDTFLKTFVPDGTTAMHLAERFSSGEAAAAAMAVSSYGSTAAAPQPPIATASPTPDPVRAAEKGLDEAARVAARKEQVLSHEQQDVPLADLAGHGLQPPLDPRDWQRVADARHFSRYALGSYGWLLYTFNNLSCLFTCRACRCCRRARYDRANMIGSGCGAGVCTEYGCCHWSLSSFLLTTGVRDQDMLYAHLASSPIYYLSVDHAQKCLVVCCRGTLSVADAVIDLDAQLSPLDQYGYPGSYTHTGILENALRLREDLDRRGHLARFLEHHPTYNLCIVGHSLGAATAALLTLLLRERYDAGPPLVATAGRLTAQSRNRLTCISYGCPLLVDLGLAHSEFALRCITSIVNHSDIISRLSLATCALLKDQMISCFDVSSASKFRILANSLRDNYEHSFEPGSDMHAVGSPSFDEDEDASSPGVSAELMLGSVARAMERLDVLPEAKEDTEARDRRKERAASHEQADLLVFDDVHSAASPAAGVASASASTSAPPPAARSPDHLSPLVARPQISASASAPGAPSSQPSEHDHTSGLPSIPAVVVTSHPRTSPGVMTPGGTTTAPRTHNEFTMHLRKCYLPGRIYHLLPGRRDPAQARCFGLRRAPRGTVVYPAAQETFQEIHVNKSMFSDHMPEKYQLDDVAIPDAFVEPRDYQLPEDERQLSHSPPTADQMEV